MGHNSPYKGDALSPISVISSAAIGQRLAAPLVAKARPNYSATIRHTLAREGVQAATALACRLLDLNHADACTHVARLMNTQPNDIVTPHADD